ncbi:MAG: hypothetical protein JWM35_1405, partial [Verrucomicrobia bacterium]|nr:hypothetical protein [Verrucomicrobiota bacterium]
LKSGLTQLAMKLPKSGAAGMALAYQYGTN